MKTKKLPKDEIVLKGDVFDSFERVEEIDEIIILGKDGGVRRLKLGNVK